MKTSIRKSVIVAILGLTNWTCSLPAQAQEIPDGGPSSSSDSIVALAANSQSLSPITAADTPGRGATYWWVYPGGEAVPAPCLPLDASVPIYGMTSQEFLVDLTGGAVVVTPYQLSQQGSGSADAYASAVAAQVQGLMHLITWIQTPAPLVTAPPETAMTTDATLMAGGLSPMYQTANGPYLTIAPTGTNGVVLVSVWNSQGPANYEIWTAPVLANPTYPWTAIAAGTTGQTNFYLTAGEYYTGFYRAIWDTNAIPAWEAANPNNPGGGPLAVFIDSPANGTVLQ